MSAQVILLRGINVGGHGKLPMAELRAILDDLGGGGAKTHLQSGNAVCPVAIDPTALAERIRADHGFRPMVVAMSANDWRARIDTNPFPTDPSKALHGFFHDGDRLDPAPMNRFLAEPERLSAHGGVLWLHAPDGIGRSKIAAAAERLAGRPLTARNWNSIAAIGALLDGL